MAKKDTPVTSPDEPEMALPEKKVAIPKKQVSTLDIESRRLEHERRVRGGK